MRRTNRNWNDPNCEYPKVFVLSRSRSTRNWSGVIVRRLNRMGIPTVRVNPDRDPSHAMGEVKLLINYGCGTMPYWFGLLPRDCKVLNDPNQVRISSHKKRMTNALRELVGECHILPSFTTKEQAQNCIDAGGTIIARTVLQGHSGQGIVISPPDPLPDASLYTKVIRKRGMREYRIYYVEDQVMDVVCKKRKTLGTLVADGVPMNEAATWWDDLYHRYVRTNRNGWTFAYQDLPVNDTALFSEIAEAAAKVIPWGVVDVLIDTESHDWRIIEVNSAPGMSGETARNNFINTFASMV